MKGRLLVLIALVTFISIAGIALASSDDSSADPDYNIYSPDGLNVWGTYTYVGDKLTLMANGSGYDAEGIKINFVGDANDVEEIQVEGFRNDLPTFFVLFPNAADTHYDGTFQAGNTSWTYSRGAHTLVINKVGSNDALENASTPTGSSLYNFNVMKNDTQLILTVNSFKSGGAYLLNGFRMQSCSFPDYDTPSTTLLYGATVVEATFGSLTSISLSAPFSNWNGNVNLMNTLQSVTLPNLVSINNGTFTNFTALTDLTMGSVTTVGNNAFKGCTGLVNVSLPSLTSIGSEAFSGCIHLESIAFGNGANLGASAFAGCEELTTISAEKVGIINYSAFDGCEALSHSFDNPGSLVFSVLETTSSFNGYSENKDYSPFRGCIAMTVVEMPSIATLGSYTFYGCTGLTTVVIGNTLETVTTESFYGCTSLSSLTIGNNVTSLGSGAFNGCSALTSVTFPDSLTTIGSSAFASTGLSSIDTNNVVTIGNMAFSSCGSLNSAVFGAPLVTVGDRAFYGSNNLTGDIVFDINLTAIGESAFYATRISTLAFATYSESPTTIAIGNDAFHNCTTLSTLTLGDRVGSIGDSAFYGCSLINHAIALSAKTTSIGENAFYNCTKITGLTIPSDSKLSSVGTKAFYNCHALGGVVSFPGTIANIGDSAFDADSNMQIIITTLSFAASTVPSLSIGDKAFKLCSQISGTIVFPASLTNIGDSAFSNCSGIREIQFTDGGTQPLVIKKSAFNNCTGISGTIVFPSNLATIGSSAFYSCEAIEAIGFVAGGDLTTIENSAFYNCLALTGQLVLPNGLLTIGNESFRNTAITGTLILPSALTSVGNNAFWGCTGLTGLTLGNSLVSIGNSAFYGCRNITGDLTIPDTLKTIGSSAFSGTNASNAAKFTQVTFGTALTSIGANAFQYTLVDGTVTDGDLVFGDLLTSIGNSAFSGCTGITSLTFGTGLTSIGASAFNGCTGIEGDLSLPDNLTTIGASAFDSCAGITSIGGSGVDLSNTSVTTIGSSAFNGCSGLTGELSLPSTLLSIGSTAFLNATGLTSINFNGNTVLTTLDQGAFNGCSSIEGIITFPESLASIGNNVFKDCSSIEGIDFGSNTSLTLIGSNAFSQCTSLTGSVVLPSSLVTLGNYAFDGSAVTSISLGLSLVTIGSNALRSTELQTISIDENNASYAVSDNVLYTKDMTTAWFCPARRATSTLTLPDTVSEIHAYAFSNTFTLESITFPSSSFTIRNYAFQNSSLTGTVILPESTYQLEKGAFQYSTGITDLVIQSTRADLLALDAFTGCSGLQSLTIPVTVKIVVPKTTTTCDKAFDAGSTIQTYTFTGTDSQLPDTFYKNYWSNMPWYFSSGTANISVMFDGVQNIDSYMFYTNASNSRIVSVDMGNDVTSVGQYAFYNATRLQTLVVSENLSVVNLNAFTGCTSISSITIPIDVNATLFGVKTSALASLILTDGKTGVGVDYLSSEAANLIWKDSSNYSVSIASGIYAIGSNMYLSASGSLTVPGTVEEIHEHAFDGARITSLTIEDGVTSIADYSFGNCTSLSTVTLPNSLENITGSPFASCSVLTRVYLPITVEYKGSMFSDCSSLREFIFTRGSNYRGVDYTLSTAANTPWYALRGVNNYSVTFESGITYIGEYMFYDCVAIHPTLGARGLSGTISIPLSVTGVGKYAFKGCTNITEISITSSTVSLGNGAFEGCSGATTLTFPLTANAVVNTEAPVFQGCTGFTTINFVGTGTGYTYTGETYTLTPWYQSTRNLSITIADGITGIGAYTFKGCSKLVGSVTLGSNVAIVGDYAFDGDSGITALEINGSSVSIGDSAFRGCSGITALTIDVAVDAVGSVFAPVFEGCSSVTSLTLLGGGYGTGVDYTEEKSALTPWAISPGFTVTINAGVTKIGAYMFNGCDALNGSVTASGLRTLSQHSFDGCSSMTSFSAPLVATVSEYAFHGCTSLSTATLTACTRVEGHSFENSGIVHLNSETEVLLPNVLYVGDYAFAGSAVGKITLGSESRQYTYFGDYVLHECPNLTEANINGILARLPYNTFRSSSTAASYNSKIRVVRADKVSIFAAHLEGCTNLELVSAASVTSFEADTPASEGKFRNCTSLTTVLLSENKVTLPLAAFRGCILLSTIDMSNLSLEKGYEFYGCTSLTTATLTSVTVPAYAFYGCSALTEITAASATAIGNYAFSNTGIETFGSGTVLFPALLTIGTNVFEGCTALISVSSDMNAAGASSFKGCTVLATVSLPELTSISDSLFYGCTNLSSVSIAKAQYVSEKAFYSCGNLVTLTLPAVTRVGNITYTDDNLEDYINYSVFYGCSRLSSVTMASVTSVGAFAFYQCASLRSFNGDGTIDLSTVSYVGFAAFAYTSPTFVTVGTGGSANVGDYAFYNCSTMTSFTVNGGLSSIGKNTLSGCQIIASLTIPISADWTSNYKLSNLVSINFEVGTSPEGYNYTSETYNTTLWSDSTGYSVTFAPGITRIGDWMYLSASGTVDIPSTVTAIGTKAFYNAPLTGLRIYSATALSLGDEAFGNNTSLTTLVLPDALSSVIGSPFIGCTALRSVTLPITFAYTGTLFSGCTALNSFTFTRGTNGVGYAYSDSNYTSTPWYNASSDVTVSFNDGITSIGSNMFRGCTRLTGSVALPSTVTAVGVNAFDGDSNITSLSFAANTVTLGISSFRGCSGITSLTIPIRANTVVSSDAPAFEGCTGITALTLSGSGDGANYVDSEASNYYYALTPWYLSRNNYSMTVTISPSITSIGTNMFRGCTSLTGAVSAPGVTSVGSYAFHECIHVTSFSAPLMTSLGTYAFYGCTGITTVSANRLTAVPDYAFYGCESLVTSDTVNATSIGAYAFANSGIKNICEGGTGVDLTKATSVGESAFARSAVETIIIGKTGTALTMGDSVLLECPYLTTVTINGRLGELPLNTFRTSATTGFSSPLTTVTANSTDTFKAMLNDFRNLTSIHITGATDFAEAQTAGMFRNCVSLSTVELYNAADSLLIPLPAAAFEGCISLTTINLDHMALNNGREFYGCTSLNHVNLAQSGRISAYTFYGCEDLTDISAAKATSIGNYAFANSGMTSVTSAMFPKIGTVGDYAFANCTSLASAEISTVSTMGQYVFSGCTALTSVTLNMLQEAGYGLFSGCSRLVSVSMDAVTSVKELAFYGCSALAEISLPSLVSIGDTSATTYSLDDYESKAVFYNCVTLSRISIPSVTQIGAFAFYGCFNASALNADPGEEGLYLPNIVNIRFAAFSGTGFADVLVGKVGAGSIRTISDYAFYNCPGLRTFNSPSLTSLPAHLFNGTDVATSSMVPELRTLLVPAATQFLANIHGCTYLQTVDASSAVEFCQDAFYGCSMLNTVVLSSTSTVTLSTRMFYGCERLATINLDTAVLDGGYALPDGVDPDNPNWGIFKGCRSLVSVTMPAATKIPSCAFYGCTGLQSINFPQSAYVGSYAFHGCTSMLSAEIPAATKIYENAFSGSNSLSAINMSMDVPFLYVTDIKERAFYDCAFTELVFGPNIVTLDREAFAYNDVVRLVVPNSTNSNLALSEGLFQGCPLTEVHLSSSVKTVYSNAFDVSSTSVREISFWFNVRITTTLMRTSSIVGNGSQTVNVHADSSSAPLVPTVVSLNHIRGFGVVNTAEEYSATVTIQTEENGKPTFTNLRAIYGGKIVLPFINYGTGELVIGEYAVIDSDSRHLAVFASESDYTGNNIAKTGYAVTVYPAKNDDGVTMTSRLDGSGFDTDVRVETQSYGTSVDIEYQYVHYGGTMTIPKFSDTGIQVKALNLVRADGVSYPMDTALTQFIVGHYYGSIEMMSEDVQVKVTFVSKGDVEIVDVQIQSPFAVPANLKYMEEPEPGYAFDGWWSSEGGTGIKAGPETKFSQGQTWYAYFPAISYTISVVSDTPYYQTSFTARGPYSFHVIEGSLYYSDTVSTGNIQLFDAKSITGWSVNVYGDRYNYGTPIETENYDAYVTSPGDSIIDLYLEMNMYSITLQFTNNGEIIEEPFLINDWPVKGESREYTSGDVVSDIPYSDLENGMEMPIPLHSTYAFSKVKAGGTQIPYRNGGYFLTVTYFGDSLSIVVEYQMEVGLYTIRYSLNDDLNTVYTNSESLSLGGEFTMPSIQRNYFKSGYMFDHIEITGVSGTYTERQRVTLTQEMIDHSTYCVVDVYAVWDTLPYRVEFSLAPYTGTVPAIEDIRVGQIAELPEVTGYSGWQVSGWHWYLGTAVSDSFTADPEITKEVVDGYADGDRVIRLQVEWEKKTYTLTVDPSTGYVFQNKTVTYGDYFTLWTNTYTRKFMTFGGWQVNDTVYDNSAVVPLDDNMASLGDEHDGVIMFGMYWIKSEYQVQYNLDGGKGKVPTDDGVYIVDETEFKLQEVSESETYREGYTFQGWKYSQSSYLIYTPTSKYFEEVLAENSSSDNIVTFYAVWEQKTYKISYDLDQGVAGRFAPTKVFYGDEITISNPTRNGWEFAGWTATGLTDGALYKSTSGYRGWDGIRQVNAEMFMDLSSEDGGTVVMTANWEQATYTISYDLNGGSGTVSSQQKEIAVGEQFVLPVLLYPSRTGYDASGWGVDRNNALAPGTVFTEEMAPSSGNTLVLYAIWTPVKYTVSYRSTTDYSYTTFETQYDSPFQIPIPERAGYTFMGWNIANADRTVAYYSADNVNWYVLGDNVKGPYFKNMTASKGVTVTFDGIWEDVKYSIRYNANGGTGKAPVDGNVYVVGDPIVMKDYNVLAGTNGSKSVVGWSLEPTGSATVVTEFTASLSTYADITNTVTFYAVWVDGMCTVSVFLDGCSVSSIPAGWVESINGSYDKIVEYGSNTKDVMADWDNVNVTKDGYNFTGWSYSSAIVTSTVTVDPEFEKVNQSIMLIFGGVVATLVAVTAVMVFLRR